MTVTEALIPRLGKPDRFKTQSHLYPEQKVKIRLSPKGCMHREVSFLVAPLPVEAASPLIWWIFIEGSESADIDS